MADSLLKQGFAIRAQIIWAKERLVIGRGDYHWQYEPASTPCADAMVGLIDEAKEAMTEFKNSPPLDAALTAAAQTAEHYEIARYGTLKTWAGQLGLDKAQKLLEETLREEEKTDELLSQIALRSANREAAA